VPDWREERGRALLALAQGKRAEDRVNAARALVRLCVEDPTRAPELRAEIPRLLDDADQKVRRAGVALAAAALPPAEAEAFLGARLDEPSYEVRLEAVGQLADLALPSSRGRFAVALEDQALEVQFEAARGMVALRHSAGLDVLLKGLEHDHLRFRALGALAELGDPRALPAVQRLFRRLLLPAFERTQAAGAMIRLGDPSPTAYLFGRTKKRWSTDRALAVELLGEVKAEGARARLLEILGDVRDTCRGPAARGLGRLGDRSVIPALAQVVADPRAPEDLVLDAAEGLCLLGGTEARAPVQAALDGTQDPALRAELQEMLEDYP
jgi:HEAT repeat protein